jgi:hypothetical protein
MKPKPPSNGLSARANRCLSTAGVPAEIEAVLNALKKGALYPYFRPTLYGKKTHQEVCRWAGLDGSFRSPTIPESTRPPVISNGLSARANHCLFRAGIPAEKPAVLHALKTGALWPGKRPVNYGTQTQAELCRWAGIALSALPAALVNRDPFPYNYPKHTRRPPHETQPQAMDPRRTRPVGDPPGCRGGRTH